MTHVLEEITDCWRTELECQIGKDASWVTPSIRTNLPTHQLSNPRQTLLKQHFPWNPPCDSHIKSSEMCRSDVREQKEYYSQRLSSSEPLSSQLEQFWVWSYFNFKDKKKKKGISRDDSKHGGYSLLKLMSATVFRLFKTALVFYYILFYSIL